MTGREEIRGGKRRGAWWRRYTYVEREREEEGGKDNAKQCDRNKNREKFRCAGIESRDGGNDEVDSNDGGKRL